MYGLSNRLVDQKDKYVDRQFTLEIAGNREVGKIKATVTVFKVKNEEKSVKEFKDTIQNEFFKQYERSLQPKRTGAWVLHLGIYHQSFKIQLTIAKPHTFFADILPIITLQNDMLPQGPLFMW